MPSCDGVREKLHRNNEGWEWELTSAGKRQITGPALALAASPSKKMTNTIRSAALRTCRSLESLQSTARRSVVAGLTSGLALCAAFNPSLHAASWTSLTIDAFSSSGFRSTALAHLPDGRFVYGVAGQVFVQDAFGAAGKNIVPAGALALDPSFLAVRDATTALVGQGGYAATSNVFTFNPSSPAAGVNPAPLASPQNYTGVYWKSPTTAIEGWLVGGGNAVAGFNNVVFISLDGTKTGPITQTISTYSGGIATDAAGNLYTATYELDEFYEPTADADKVLKFPASLVEAAIQSVISGTPAPIPVSSASFVFKFDGTSNIAVDSVGRVWATGYAVNHVQVFDPATQTMARLVPQHGAFPPGTDVLYTVRSFTRSGTGYLAFLAQDEYGGAGTSVYTGHAPDLSIDIPHADQWRAQHFGVANLTLDTSSATWGPNADPDRDGVPNLVEYACGTSPVAPGIAPITPSVQAGVLGFTFIRDPLNTDLAYIVEVSDSLTPGGWQEVARSSAGAPTVSSGIGAGSVSEVAVASRFRVTVTDTAAGAHHFARLRLILTPP